MKIILQWQIDGQSHTYTMTDTGSIVIGRHPDCEITFANDDRYRTVSRRHAAILAEDGAFYLRNVSRKNKIRFNARRRLAYDESIPLNFGDVFRVGPVEIQVIEVQAKLGQPFKVRCANTTCERAIDRNVQDCPYCGTSLAFANTTTHDE